MKRPVLKITLFVVTLGFALAATSIFRGIPLFPSIPSSHLFSKAKYDWAKNCLDGEFEIQKDIPKLSSVPRRADLTRFHREEDSLFEPPFGPKPDNVKCFAEFVLDDRNQNLFDSYNKQPDGSASVEMVSNEFTYSIFVSTSAIEMYIKPLDKKTGSMISLQDSILDGRVDGIAQHKFVDNRSDKFVSSEDTSNLNRRSADGTYRHHLKMIMNQLQLPFRE